MIKIIFGKSSSQNYGRAIRRAKKNSSNFCQNESDGVLTNIAEFSFEQFNEVISLWSIVSNWKSSELLINDTEIISGEMNFIESTYRCFKQRSAALLPDEYCENINNEDESYFNCRLLKSVLRNVDSSNTSFNYYPYSSSKAWYQIGELDKDNLKFFVDKIRILKLLLGEVERCKCILCPHFDIEKLKKEIENLPSIIRLDGSEDFALLENLEDDPKVITKKELERKLQDEEREKRRLAEIEKALIEKKSFHPEEFGGNILYSDIGGLDREILLIRECIEFPFLYPEIYSHLGITPFKGILLFGPPGTGKTLLAKAVASECKMPFYSVSGPELFDKYVGESERKLREIFQIAQETSPSIIFFDEIDAIASKRVDSGSEAIFNKSVTQLLALMDGMNSDSGVVVIAATNRLNSLDSALRRPGRLDYEIYVAPPNEKGRYDILKIHTASMPIADDVNLEQLANSLHGYVGADIMALCKEAGLIAFRRFIHATSKIINYQEIKVKMEDFIISKTKISPSAGREVISIEPDVEWKDVIGLDQVKLELEKKIISPYLMKAKYPNIRKIKGILFYGPPGVGKTYLSKALAREMKMNIIALKGSDVLSKYFGESATRVSEFFKKARELAPCVLVIDEIDAIASSRHIEKVSGDLVNELLSQMDGFDELTDVLVIGTTNRIDIIDTAILRSGRFDLKIEIPNPTDHELQNMIEYYVKKTGFPFDDSILQNTFNYKTGAEVENAVTQAIYEVIWNNDFKLQVEHFT